MKNITIMKTCTFKLLLLLLLMMVGKAEVYAEKVYKLVKVNTVEYGHYYVFEQSGRVMNNEVSSGELATTNSYNSTGLTGSESYVWKVVKFEGYSNWYLRNVSENKYLCNTSGNNLGLRSDAMSSVSFTFTNGIANIKCNSKYLAYTSQSSYVYKLYPSPTSNYPHSINVYRLYAYPNLSFSSSSVTINSDEEDGLVPTFVNPEGVDGITFKSSYNEVASINSEGVITLGGSSGTAVITATYPGSAEYLADEAKCVITVNKLAQEDEPEAGGYYSRVASMGDITNGQYLIVCETQNTAFNGGLGTLDKNYNNIDVVISDNKISKTSSTEAAEFTVTSVTGGYTIRSKSGKYIGHDGSDKGLLESESTSYKNSISIDNDVMSIRMYSGYSLRYNNSYKRFRYYDGQTQTRLYKYIAPAELSTVDVVVSQAGLATYASNFDLDFRDVEGLSAYRAVESEGSVELHKVDVVPNGEGVLLRSTNGGTNFSVPVAGSATPWVDGYNDFKRGTGVAVASETDGKYNYILNVVDNKLGFYKAAGNTVATNRAYLQTSAALSRNSIVFDDEEENQTTTVTDIVNSSTCDGFLYNLNGQHVKSPSSGLYISGGKLVFKKK